MLDVVPMGRAAHVAAFAVPSRALAQQAAVLVMDEPTASLDFGKQRLVLREIDARRQQGVAVLLSTHQPEHALRIADRVALMGRDGLQSAGATAATVTAPALAPLYGVPADEVARSVARLAPPPAWVPGMLLQRGLQPQPSPIETPSRLAGCADFDEFAQRVA